MMEWWRKDLLYVLHVLLTTVSCVKVTVAGSEDTEADCALDAAMTCFQPITKLLNCTRPPLSGKGPSVPVCDSGKLTMTAQNLFLFCNSVDGALNGCLVDLLGSSCSETDPKHAHLQDWLKPLNILLTKLCSQESMHIMTEAAGCEDESIFKCLFSTTKRFDLIELLTTQIPSELCGNIELRAQFCLATTTFQPQCKPILHLLKNLTQEFVDNTQCNVQPVILVPLQTPPTSTPQPLQESDKACELSHDVLSACFEPMMSDWNCYFGSESESGACAFNLDSLCATTREAFESCAMNLIGYGCEETKAHQQQYYKWLMAIGDVQDQLCVASPTTTIALPGAQDSYFTGKVECWKEFFTCLHSVPNQKQLVTFITEDITTDVCRDMADDVDRCLMMVGFSGDLHECDLVLDKIQFMKNAFTMSTPCVNATPFLSDEFLTENNSQIILITPTLILFHFIIHFLF